MAKAKPPETVTITYDLFDLPTAQHKAGLAGLLLQIEHMEERKLLCPSIVEMTSTTATIAFTADSVKTIMDHLYDAEPVVVRVKQKWANAKEIKPSVEIEEEIVEKGKDGKPRIKKVKTKYFFHEQVQPTGHFLKQYLPKMDPQKDWHKLWRDMLWAIPRGNPQSRDGFEQRAKQKSCKEGETAWDDLLKLVAKREKNVFHTSQVAGSLWLGAQAVNAESIAFEGRVEQTLLLHFWPLVVQIFVPAVLKVDRKDGKLEVKSEFVGYVLAIPEIADLVQFQQEYKVMLGGLGEEIRGFRPAQAVIDLPAEGALSFLAHLGTQKAAGSEVRYSISSVEYLHQVKIGNNIKTQAAGRVDLHPGLIEDYERIIGNYANPLFRRGLMHALLDNKPWFQPFGKLFAEWDVSFFVPTDASPKLSWFWADARKYLRQLETRVKDSIPDAPPDEDEILANTVNRLVYRYLTARIEAAGVAKTQSDTGEARRKLAERLFLELRSRREQAFVDHFTNTFFSVPQYLGQKPAPKMFERIAKALFDRSEDVKTLTLMALSANGWVATTKKEKV